MPTPKQRPIEEKREEIKRLTEFWYEYIGGDHHKDRDCHFYINETWSYGEYPKFSVEHFGYIAHDVEPITCETHEEAENALLGLLRDIIEEEKSWAERVLAKEEGWDSDQIDRAKKVANFNL